MEKKDLQDTDSQESWWYLQQCYIYTLITDSIRAQAIKEIDGHIGSQNTHQNWSKGEADIRTWEAKLSYQNHMYNKFQHVKASLRQTVQPQIALAGIRSALSKLLDFFCLFIWRY